MLYVGSVERPAILASVRVAELLADTVTTRTPLRLFSSVLEMVVLAGLADENVFGFQVPPPLLTSLHQRRASAAL